jgi:nucleoprotein TPR
LQSSLEENGQEKNGLEVRCNLLQKRVDDLESKLAVKMDHLQEVENDRIISEQQFKNEMNAQKKLTELYLGKSQELSTHNLELESLVRELESKVLEMNEEKEASVREFEDQLARQKKIEQQQELELEQIRSQIKLINNDLKMDKQADQVAQLSQTAAAASRFQKTGKSFTQVVKTAF